MLLMPGMLAGMLKLVGLSACLAAGLLLSICTGPMFFVTCGSVTDGLSCFGMPEMMPGLNITTPPREMTASPAVVPAITFSLTERV